MAETLTAVARGEGDEDRTGKLLRWSRQLPGRGACGLLDALDGALGSIWRHVAAALGLPGTVPAE
ncbi:hypothetical protein ACIHCM_14255 [Streptomyces sp. NPDC052023]|uniref:hypothetical protein n=1 Tax=Streptomyces sp. NPDC052023 TaxID=3365681 RepID=UPI0037D6A77A